MNVPIADLRNLFIRLLHREIDADSRVIARDFLQVALAEATSTEKKARYRAAGFPASAPLASLLRCYAPTALLQWDWLRSISRATLGHQAANAALFSAYLDAVGLRNPADSLAAQYRALLIQAGLSLPALPHLVDDPNLPQAVWLAPCLTLALSHFPLERGGEILGYSLAHCQENAVWLEGLEQQLQQRGLCANYCQRQRKLSAKHQAVLLAMQASHDDPSGIAAGYALYQYGLQSLNEACNTPLEPDLPVEAMLLSKLPYALGYHGRIQLQDKTLDQWLADGDLAGLKQALQQSPCVRERLFRSMPFGAAMFGVFSDEEQGLLRAWLEETGFSSPSGRNPGTQFALNGNQEPTVSDPLSLWERVGVRVSSACKNQQHIDILKDISKNRLPGDVSSHPNPLPVRDLYHQLLNREIYPNSVVSADLYAKAVLRRTRSLAPLQLGLKRRFSYTPVAFKQRLDAIYRQEIARYRPLSGAPRLPRELYRWGITQMAPAILLDGCWLENLASTEVAQDEVQRRLLQTFADEVGYGNTEHNHPHVYRRLLHNLDIVLPPEASQAFAQHSQLCDAAFALPGYLLAIGVWPERFFPEILGLNLAIELSGLGAGYMQLIDALRYYQIDATIIQLHLSIDNLASGHAALAREAIVLYLDQFEGDTQAAIWQRIWSGYLSLNVAALPFALAGLRQYLLCKFQPKIAH